MGKEQQYAGVLAIVDAATMRIEQTVTAPADVKSAPLVTKAYDGETYVYYTANTTPGGLYVLKAGADQAESLFVPTGDGQNYCMTSVMADEEGTLYYTNDSGRLFAVASNVPEEGGDDTSGSSSESQEPSQSQPPQESESSSSGAQSNSPEDSSAVTSSPSSSENNPPTGESDAAFLVMGLSIASLGLVWFARRRRHEA